MKNLIMFALFSAVSVSMSAQLEVTSVGKTIVGTSGGTSICLQSNGSVYAPLLGPEEYVYTITSGSGTQVQKVAICGQALNNSVLFNDIPICGVKGIAGNGKSGFNYGLMGVLSGTSNGAAVFGTTNSSCPTLNHKFAGYFDGDVTVNGLLIAPGPLQSNGLLGLTEPLSAVVQSGYAPAFSDRLAGIDVVKSTKTYPCGNGGDNGSEQQASERTHYAFVTENISELFPELVGESVDGDPVVDYMELIPVLVKSVGELTKRVNELEGENARLKQAMMQSAIGSASQSGIDGIAYGLTGIRKNTRSGLSIRNGKKTSIGE